MTPRILISGCDESRFNYENAILKSGGTPCSYYCPPLDESCDALLLCGGNDVDPAIYGQEINGSVDIDYRRDGIEAELIRRYAAAGKLIFGICRGMQLINAVMGGDMIQDLPGELRKFHSHWERPDYKVHSVWSSGDSFLHRLYGDMYLVNSCHHQAVGRLAPGFRAAAFSEGGVVEAIAHETLPIRGVQWHPERMAFTNRRLDTVDGAPIFQWFLAAAAE